MLLIWSHVVQLFAIIILQFYYYVYSSCNSVVIYISQLMTLHILPL